MDDEVRKVLFMILGGVFGTLLITLALFSGPIAPLMWEIMGICWLAFVFWRVVK